MKNLIRINDFAKLHDVNKRTLHYYDEIDLFKPAYISENSYRYYSLDQSLQFEFIKTLQSLNMSIAEIKEYLNNIDEDRFIEMTYLKEEMINNKIKELLDTKTFLQSKRQDLLIAKNIKDYKIELIDLKEDEVYVLPYNVYNDLNYIYKALKENINIKDLREGVGSYITLENINKKQFYNLEGIYLKTKKELNLTKIKRNSGKYIKAYFKGRWDDSNIIYEKILKYADENNLKLIGNSYERGLNEFVLKNESDYITEILIEVINK